MRKRPKAQNVEQLDLFVPPPQRPIWGQLPPPIKQKLVELLGDLLRGQGRPRAENVKEGTDE